MLAPNDPLAFIGFESGYDTTLEFIEINGIASRYLPTSAAHALYPLLKCCLITSVEIEFGPLAIGVDAFFCLLSSCKCFNVNSNTSAFSNLVIDSPDSV